MNTPLSLKNTDMKKLGDFPLRLCNSQKGTSESRGTRRYLVSMHSSQYQVIQNTGLNVKLPFTRLDLSSVLLLLFDELPARSRIHLFASMPGHSSVAARQPFAPTGTDEYPGPQTPEEVS